MTIPQMILVSDTLNQDKTIRQIIFRHDLLFEHETSRVVGLDPGTTRIGLAKIGYNIIVLNEIHIHRGITSEERIAQIWKLLYDLTGLYLAKTLTIEGASYADKYRQVELQDIRCGAVAWAMKHNISVQIIPPNTIRKVVFGSAKIKNPWKEQGIPDNAAAALACALYPIMKEKGK